jgi:cysteinyl-tRNA synthetase
MDPRPFAARVREALDDDLDAPRAIEALDDLASAVLSGGDDPDAPATLLELGDLLGLDLRRAL